MRRLPIDHVKEGMQVGKTIYGLDGHVLLHQGVVLRESFIQRLKELNIFELYIDDEISRDIIIKDVISDETRFEARIALKNTMDSLRIGQTISQKPIRDAVNKMIDELLESNDTIIGMQEIKSTDQYTFCHSVNVCVMSLLVGIGLGYDKERLKDFGAGAILHDVGKTRVPNDILNKPDKLTPEEFDKIKKHTNYGYEIIKRSNELSTYASYIALTHHEKYNGEGYPLGLKGDEIHPFSKIVAIADVYDAITSDRVYRRRIRINDAVEYMVGMSNHHFDFEYVKKFTEHIALYPPGSCIKLNTGQKAIVVDINRDYPNRPVIRILKDEEGQPVTPYEVDLTRKNTLLIDEIIDDI